MILYPLIFQTIYKDKIWGGHKIKNLLGKDTGSLPNCGETWEISGVAGDVSIVANGALKGKSLQEVVSQYKGQLVGESIYNHFGDEFPLLIKFIDANDDLSIQVHPDDALAKERHNGNGKTEMWYILQADAGAKLISGFNRKLTKDTYLEAFESGKLTDILCETSVEAEDVYFLPAGRVHTIGKGILLAEIQQTSDITYRIYDFDRVDAQGNKRELHVAQALDAINFNFVGEPKTSYKKSENETVAVVDSPHFTTNRLNFTTATTRQYDTIDSFVILICVSGSVKISVNDTVSHLKMGECLLIPAEFKMVHLEPELEFTILETYIKLS
jgi:mannose-6-phosphate isomerase